MNWKLIVHGSNSGKFNMEFDLDLIKQCNPSMAFLRFYRWKPYCISLGVNQNIKEINEELTAAEGIEIVKRPTGGRAILHAEELTYSVVMPLRNGLSAKEIYTKISTALVKGLGYYHPKLNKVELESEQPNFPSLLKHPSGSLCFASTAKSEVKFAGKKLIGSAQRKMGDFVLQHGSILCGTFHRKLPAYLIADTSTREHLQNELVKSTTEIEEITCVGTDYGKLTNSLIKGFKEEWEVKLADDLRSES